MPQQPQPQGNSGKSSTYVQLPDNSYLEVPAGVSDQEVHSRISGMFPDAFKSDPSAASPIAPPTMGKPQAPDMRKVYLNTGNPVPDRPGVDLLTKNGAGVARAIYSQTTPGVIHGLLKRFGVTQSGPDLMKETIPNAVATFAGGLEGAPEGAGGEGGARPVERSGSNRPATRGPVPGRATPSKSTFGPMDAATLLPGMAGRAARLLQKFGIGQAETAAPQMAEPMADFGTPSHLRGQRVKAGTLTLDTGIPKSVRPEPAWKSQPANGGTPVESILQRNPEAGTPPPRQGNSNNAGAPFPRKPTWQNQPTPESRAASDAAFNKLHPVSEFKSGMDPVAEAQWQESAFGQKPIEDIGAKVRANRPAVPRSGKSTKVTPIQPDLTPLEREAMGEGPQRRMVGTPDELKIGAKPKLVKANKVTTADEAGRAIDNQALGNVMKGEDARNLSTSDLSSRLQEAAKSANKVKSGPDLLVKKLKVSDVGEINPHPRRYYPEQDISDEELGNALGLKKNKPAAGPEGPFKPGMGPGAMLKKDKPVRMFHGTAIENVPDIVQDGLHPARSSKVDPRREGPYVTGRQEEAQAYAEDTNTFEGKPGQGAIVALDIPRKMLRGTHDEYYPPYYSSHDFGGRAISPDYINHAASRVLHKPGIDDILDDYDVKQRLQGRVQGR